MTTLPAPDDRHWLIKTVFLRKEKTIPSALLMAAVFVCNGLTPVIVGHAIDEAVTTGQISALVKWLAILCCTFALNMACGWFGRGLFNRAMLEVGHELRMAVTDRIQDPRGMAGPRHTAGELLSIASTDTQRIANAVIMTVFPVAEIASIVYAASMTAAVNIPLGIAMLAGGPIVVWLSVQGSKPLRRRSGRRQAALAAASATATDVVEGLRILKGLGAVDTVRRRYKHVSDTAYERTVDANAARARLNAQTETVGSVYVILIGVAAGWLALAGTVSVGQLITVIGLTQFIITPMTMLGKNIASRWANAQASSVRVTGILGADFAFDDANAAVPALEPGITVVSTPAPAELAQLPRHQITVAPHRADLFEGTVVGNVHADRERALVALHVAAAEDIPGGPDREVGENGKNLSGGQRQRVALARAIASDADILVLQDPTTAVDSVTEQCIAERVARHRSGKATVVYTQAPAWRAVANDKAVDAELAWLSQGGGR